MSIVPVNNQTGSSSSSKSFDLWDPLTDPQWDDLLAQNFPFFPSMFSAANHLLPSFGFPSLGTHVDWKETQRAHVFRAVFNRADQEEADVLVYIDDDDMLQINTENGKFMTKFKLPENVKRDQITTSMINGVLTITIPKDHGDVARNPNVRSIEITGSG